MALSVQEFWQVVVASGLHDEENCRRLADAFAKARETGAVPRTLSLPEWMLTSGEMTRYQAKILLAGKPGPFLYGDYLVTDRLEMAGLPGLFRAVHRPTNINVALYFLSGTLTDPSIVTKIAQEAAAAAALSRSGRGSAYLTHCHTLVDLEAYKFLVVDELPMTTLADRLAGGSFSAKEATRIVCQVALALTRFGEYHRAHGAIRPARIWLTSAGAVRLATFPLARDPLAVVGAHASFDVEQAGVDYCAPECASGEPPTPLSDVYSLGCVFYEMLAGRVPFPTGEREQRLQQHRSAMPPPLNEINAAIPKPLAALAARMLAKKPADRAPCVPTLLKQVGAAVDTAVAPEARAKLDSWLAEQGEDHPPMVAGSGSTVPILFNPLDSTPVTAAARRNHGRRSNTPLIVGAVAASLILVGGLAFFFTAGMPDPQRTLGPTSVPSPPLSESDHQDIESAGKGPEAPVGISPERAEAAGAGSPSDSETTDQPAIEAIVAVEGTMWAAPTHGAAVDLTYLAPGAEVIVALRPRQFARNPETEKLLDPRTLGALGDFISKELPALAGAPLSDIDAALIGVLDSSSGVPRFAAVLTLCEARPLETLLQVWGDPVAQERDGATFYKKGDRAFWLPTADPSGKIIVVGPADLIADDVIPARDNPPALGRDMEDLLAASDRDRDLTILASPGLLQTASREWFPGYAARLRAPLAWFLSSNEAEAGAEVSAAPETARATDSRAIDMSSHGLPQAVLASAHLSDADLFLEMRTIAATNQPAAALARVFRERLARLPKRVSEYIRTLELSDYSHDVLFDFPLMVEQAGRYTVVGTEGRQVVLRTYLPSVAAHNLALGSHLALAERARPPMAGGTRPTAKSPTAEPLAKRLDRKMSLVFDRATMEKALQMVGEEIGAEVEILGADLQLEGITKNQSFGLDLRDETAREILRNIMMRASPDGKLIYVIRAPPAGGAEALVITTRASARQRGEAVPAEFAEQP